LKYLISIIFIIGILAIIPSAIAQSSDVPDWVKNNALWWAEGKISEQEYLDAIKFLVDNQVIKIETVKRLAKSLEAEEHDRLLNIARERGYISESDNYLDAIKVRLSGGDCWIRILFCFRVIAKQRQGRFIQTNLKVH